MHNKHKALSLEKRYKKIMSIHTKFQLVVVRIEVEEFS